MQFQTSVFYVFFVFTQLLSIANSQAVPYACQTSPCGGSICIQLNHRPICCLPGSPQCSTECITSSDCAVDKACVDQKCVNPCLGVCAHNADCRIISHRAVCSCPSGMSGDPFENCSAVEVRLPRAVVNPCEPSPCGKNTKCRIDKALKRPVCSCITKMFTGSPLEGCEPKLEEYVDPCIDACVHYAVCEVKAGKAQCTCAENFVGDGTVYCAPECQSHSDCPGNRACIGLKCGDPCDPTRQPCGTNALCRVNEKTHKAICRCPSGWKGHPFEACYPSS